MLIENPNSHRLPIATHLQLGLGLGLLEDGLHLGGLHNVALDLELTGHEETLGIGLARNEAHEIGIGEGQGNCVAGFVSLDSQAGEMQRRTYR